MRYLSVEEVLLIHEYQLQRYGGSPGLRSIHLLESSVCRPQTSYGGNELYRTPFDKAACLIHSLILNHPFIDGNKRTGMVAGTLFLRLNGYSLKLSTKNYVKTALEIANHSLELGDLSETLGANSKPHD